MHQPLPACGASSARAQPHWGENLLALTQMPGRTPAVYTARKGRRLQDKEATAEGRRNGRDGPLRAAPGTLFRGGQGRRRFPIYRPALARPQSQPPRPRLARSHPRIMGESAGHPETTADLRLRTRQTGRPVPPSARQRKHSSPARRRSGSIRSRMVDAPTARSL